MLICSVCGEAKPPYHFFNYRNKYDRDFFIHIPARSDVCWDCAGPYRCIYCQEIRPAWAFRIQGRVCTNCKEAGGFKNAAPREIARTNSDLDASQVAQTVDEDNASEIGGVE